MKSKKFLKLVFIVTPLLMVGLYVFPQWSWPWRVVVGASFAWGFALIVLVYLQIRPPRTPQG